MGERNPKKNLFKRLIERLRKPRGDEAAAPAAEPEPVETVPSAPTFSFDRLARRLHHADDPIAALRDFTANVEKRIAAGNAVAPLEAFLAHALEDAGLDGVEVDLPDVSVVRPPASGLFYLRMDAGEIPYLALLHVLGIEAALNATQLASQYFGERGPSTEAEVWQFAQHLPPSIISQILSIEPLHLGASPQRADGEWTVRTSISAQIESFRLPWRLNARFRANVAAGDVAFECDLAPLHLMWRRTSIDGVRVVPTTAEMMHRSATDYNARLAILLAACAFKASMRIEHVWVAGVIDTAHHHSCLYSVCFDRDRFEHLTLDDIHDPVAVLRSFDAAIDVQEGLLTPVHQGFSLDDELFCPPRRFEEPEVSARLLPEPLAHALGTASVAGLGIDERARRNALAREISRKLGSSTAENVETILEVAGDDPDPSVRAAAERTVKKLIEGTIDEDAFSIIAAFTEDDELAGTVGRARMLISSKDIESAELLLAAALAPLEGIYEDSRSVVWRVFTSYVDRVVYNRLAPDAGKTVLLAPTSYLEALLMHALCLTLLDRHDEAIRAARRACTLAPAGGQAQLALIQCLEAADRSLEAMDELCSLLEHAHDAVGIGLGYYRMAFFQWQLGEVKVAQACYLRALRYMPEAMAVVGPELQVMALQGAERLDDISDPAVDELLEEHGIPLAPTPEIRDIFFEGMSAALDAEVFPVAKSFLIALGAMHRNDVFYGVLRSLEDEPDR